MNPIKLSFYLFFNLTLTLIKLFLIPSRIISIHQRGVPVNTLYALFYGRLLFNEFSQFLPTRYFNDNKLLFENLINLTEPICQSINTEKFSMTNFNTSGIEA